MHKIDELIKTISDEDRRYIEDLIETGQTELLNHEGINERNILDIIKQIKEFELVYPDGLRTYVERAKTLMKKSEKKMHKFAHCVIERPDNLIKIKFPWDDMIPQFGGNNREEKRIYVQDGYCDGKEDPFNVSTSTSNESSVEYDANGTFTQDGNFVSLSEGETTPLSQRTISHRELSTTGIPTTPLSSASSNGQAYDPNLYRSSYLSLCDETKGKKQNKTKTQQENQESETIEQIEQYLHYEQIGLSQIDRVCFVLLAGGLGERLNHKDIKLKLLTNLVSEKTYIEYYCNYLKVFQEYIKREKNKEVEIPFIIMLSDDTYEETVTFLRKNNFFTLKENQMYFLKQKKVLCFKDSEAHIDFVFQNESFIFSKKPHGHGDIHSLIRKYINLDDLIEEGYRYLYFFQDTNALAMKVLFACLGVSIEKELHMNFLAISRNPGEEIGAICNLIDEDNCKRVVNIEYNFLESILTGSGGQELVDEDGFSLFPGNTSSILFEMKTYNELLKRTNGVVPEYVNPKYADHERKHFVRATRVECMMQDFAFLYYSGGREGPGERSYEMGMNIRSYVSKRGRVGVTHLDRCLCFSPVKNDSTKAKRKVQSGIHPECMFSAEADLYYNNCAFLQLACLYNRKIFLLDELEMKTFKGVGYFLPPKVLLEPQFAFTLTDLIKKVTGNISISRSSTLWVKSDALIQNLHLDGALIIGGVNSEEGVALPVILEKNLCVRNRGDQFLPLSGIEDENSQQLQIRGYKLVRREVLMISG
ncbi:UTP--glucose-1-phosphate uridylyltransferase, putative [Plasmodium knowlesi strain H]|uniref:UTP-monosaccharide-1-phosphate uridylyltransferase n=3 Tax=Plasmodium knowlesi TaxID=5850 RepID=A0A5K1VPB3_PLAKH|nr:uncharacterized protein PKNH_1015800 [Plasmodium knowlesi strain H]OTN67170.1 putative UTP--glucose-1-phosphate uridylyltransferase [Plasmodium knowlesi]CAA9988664.1 UTP--glucose-1-phosphate uridylyltransferase, putative [Plasmodium knowlesi strain H]SBO21552.1 UTP--glucose-1-phosphate uridylyltransferase, putative [Plasmodium knowlesi strain H]SBO21938.1 UTP--glucose-1-phosphate uridylyltransferase, putative [Plasmodium knowlesi strain H]VVS78138.1 UTP--glucose-1-phosphate uridylyltransfer|eukprot:XP_002259641.1 [Plasmodium knowlesi strain H]